MKKEIKIVDEKRGIVQVTMPDERWYFKPSENKTTGLPEYAYIPSVTWICSFYPKGVGFYKWLANTGWDESQAIKEAAGSKGSKVHQAINAYLLGEEIKMDAKLVNPNNGQEEELTIEEYDCLVSFVRWFETFEKQPKILATEITVFNDKEGYAGTVDLLCEIEGEVWLIDFKTGQSVWPEYELQLSAYKYADLPKKVDKMGVLQIGYKRNKNSWKFSEIEDKFDLFLAAKKIWLNETAGQEPKQKDYPLSVKIKTKVKK